MMLSGYNISKYNTAEATLIGNNTHVKHVPDSMIRKTGHNFVMNKTSMRASNKVTSLDITSEFAGWFVISGTLSSTVH